MREPASIYKVGRQQGIQRDGTSLSILSYTMVMSQSSALDPKPVRPCDGCYLKQGSSQGQAWPTVPELTQLEILILTQRSNPVLLGEVLNVVT